MGVSSPLPPSAYPEGGQIEKGRSAKMGVYVLGGCGRLTPPVVSYLPFVIPPQMGMELEMEMGTDTCHVM